MTQVHSLEISTDTACAARFGVRPQSNLKDADVLINDSLAGKVRDLKTLWLETGAYNLKVQTENYAPYTVRIYVLGGKTLKVDANLAPPKEP